MATPGFSTRIKLAIVAVAIAVAISSWRAHERAAQKAFGFLFHP